jgi:L-alanine-DL-glutamate epimerase-like enolase superfamily enzyme
MRSSARHPPLRSSYGLHAPYALRTILELKTEDGLTGIAETYGGEAITLIDDRGAGCPLPDHRYGRRVETRTPAQPRVRVASPGSSGVGS